jgi:hypothetical protein
MFPLIEQELLTKQYKIESSALTGLKEIFTNISLNSQLGSSVSTAYSVVSIVRIGFDPQQRQRIFPLTPMSRQALGPTQPPIQQELGALSLGVKRNQGVMLTIHHF